MRNSSLKYTIILLFSVITYSSCEYFGLKSYENSEDFLDVKKQLIKQFGNDAYYTGINIANSSDGGFIFATMTKDPSSLKLEEWVKINGVWEKSMDVNVEILSDTDPTLFMFQLNDATFDFNTLGTLVLQAKERVMEEKNTEKVKLSSISMDAPIDGDYSKAFYRISIEDKKSGDKIELKYDLNKELITR